MKASSTTPSLPAACRNDLEALGKELARELPSLEETKTILLASSRKPALLPTSAHSPTKEKKIMSKMRRRPLLAAAVITAVLCTLVPATYAVVHHYLLTVDTDLPEEELKQSVEDQLAAAGISGAEVAVDKSNGATRVVIAGDGNDDNLSLKAGDIEVKGAGAEAHDMRRSISLEVEGELTADDTTRLFALLKGPKLVGALTSHQGEGEFDAAGLLAQLLIEEGFDTEVIEEEQTLRVVVRGLVAPSQD